MLSSLKTSKVAFFDSLRGILALFCDPLFRSFSALIFIGFDYLVKTSKAAFFNFLPVFWLFSATCFSRVFLSWFP
jgi:hypothetical protein